MAPGDRVSLVVQVTPRPTMHLYAPGKHGYQVVRLVIDPQPWLRAHETTYPSSEIYHFKPLDERVEVYSKPFRLVRDVTILASPEMQKVLAADARSHDHRRARVSGLRRQGVLQPRARAPQLHVDDETVGSPPPRRVGGGCIQYEPRRCTCVERRASVRQDATRARRETFDHRAAKPLAPDGKPPVNGSRVSDPSDCTRNAPIVFVPLFRL